MSYDVQMVALGLFSLKASKYIINIKSNQDKYKFGII